MRDFIKSKPWHIGYLVKDLDKSLAAFTKLTGATVLDRIELIVPQEEIITGKPFHVKNAFAEFGGTVFEFVHPMDDYPDSYVAIDLARRGEGVHHVAYEISEDYTKTVEELLAAGWEMLLDSIHDNVHACHIKAPDGELILELTDKIPAGI